VKKQAEPAEAEAVGPNPWDRPALSRNELDYWFSLIDDDEAARFIGTSVRTLQRLDRDGAGPPRTELSVGRHARTRRGIALWLRDRTRSAA
jgi:hypothetical protein